MAIRANPSLTPCTTRSHDSTGDAESFPLRHTARLGNRSPSISLPRNRTLRQTLHTVFSNIRITPPYFITLTRFIFFDFLMNKFQEHLDDINLHIITNLNKASSHLSSFHQIFNHLLITVRAYQKSRIRQTIRIQRRNISNNKTLHLKTHARIQNRIMRRHYGKFTISIQAPQSAST